MALLAAMQHRMDLKPPPSLGQIAEGAPLALFLDFDGTLVDIAATHDAIKVPSRLPGALDHLAGTLGGRLALVSGRSLDDLALHLGQICIAQAGSHGADCRLADGERVGTAPRVMSHEAARDLARITDAFAQATVEYKSHGAALHYRAIPQDEDALVAAAQEVAERHALATKRGKCVIELLSERADKGTAVRLMMAHPPFTGAFPVFVGDDVTDEDGFRAANGLGGTSILVGDERESAACYRLESPQDIYRWLNLEIA